MSQALVISYEIRFQEASQVLILSVALVDDVKESDVTSTFCNFSVIPSRLARKMFTKFPGVELL